MRNTLFNKKAILVFHEGATGPAHDLRDYLLKEGISELLFIIHPLIYIKDNIKNSSYCQLYKKGKLVKTIKAYHWLLPEYLLYIKDFLYTYIWSVKLINKCDVFFGFGNLNAFAGYFLKVRGTVNKLIYYVIDYIPNRFENNIINSIYHYIEKKCANSSDWTWNLSPRMIEARRRKWGFDFPNQLVVMHGVHFDRIKRVSFNKINKYEIIYMGGLLKKQGIQLVIKSLPLIIQKIPGIKLTIIGKGPYENELKALMRKLNLEHHISFLGYIPSHKEVENRLAKASLAMAMYELKGDNFTYYTDPGKVKNYLGAGLPVLITDVPYIAKLIDKEKCGIIVPYNTSILAKKITEYLSDEESMKKYRKNALKFAKKYDWDIIFTNALEPLMKRLN